MTPDREFDDARDAHDSYYAAIAEIGRRIQAGEEPTPTTGYFGCREPRPAKETTE